jgi:hypothetical protein
MLAGRSTAALGLLVVVGSGCASRASCGFEPAPIPLPTSAIFDLSCGATDLTSVALSGPCATGDASPSNYLSGQSVEVSSPTPGVCHVDLTFATGFTYSADVTFESHTINQPICDGTEIRPYVAPTQTPFTVNTPSTTCVDAGLDASVSDTQADAPTDAPSEAAVDAQADAGADE